MLSLGWPRIMKSQRISRREESVFGPVLQSFEYSRQYLYIHNMKWTPSRLTRYRGNENLVCHKLNTNRGPWFMSFWGLEQLSWLHTQKFRLIFAIRMWCVHYKSKALFIWYNNGYGNWDTWHPVGTWFYLLIMENNRNSHQKLYCVKQATV